MADFDAATGTFVIPWWGVLALVAIIVALGMTAVLRAGAARALTLIAQCAAVSIVAYTAWAFLDRQNMREETQERRAFETRLAELSARAMAPGSVLSCLDGAAAEAVENACEKSLFANPESVAAAISYVGERIALLTEAVEAANRNPGRLDPALANLRRGLEADRYGIVAHVLATLEGCGAGQCRALQLLNEPGRVQANLKERPFDILVGRNFAAWLARAPQPPAPNAAGTPVAAAPAQAAPPAEAAAANFPSASTIPPVSIMNNEPGMTGQNGMDGLGKPEAKAEAKPPVPPRRPNDKQSAKRNPAAAPANPDAAPRTQ